MIERGYDGESDGARRARLVSIAEQLRADATVIEMSGGSGDLSRAAADAIETCAAREPEYLRCVWCSKEVSTGFYPVPTDTPDRGLIVRAVITCPECEEAIADPDGENDEREEER